MLKPGRFNTLTITRRTDIGLWLDGGRAGEILLPRRYVEDSMQVGESIEVFVYFDSEDRLVATTESPKAQVGECAYLKVVSTTKIGAFLDWGLPKDLLVPFGEQQQRMQKGYSYVVYLYIDEASGRICASSKLERHLRGDASSLQPRQPVDCLVFGKSDLGFKAVIDDRYIGQFFANETFRHLHHGERVQAYVKNIRSDGKVDLMLQLPYHLEADRLGEQIVEHLRQHEGYSTLTDRSPPEEIYQVYGVSKANYKKALGRLYKQRIIRIDDSRITLL